MWNYIYIYIYIYIYMYIYIYICNTNYDQQDATVLMNSNGENGIILQ